MNANFTRCIARLQECASNYNSLGCDPICLSMGINPYSEQTNRRHERQLLEIIRSEGYADAGHLAQEALDRGLSRKWLHFNVDIYLPIYETEDPVPVKKASVQFNYWFRDEFQVVKLYRGYSRDFGVGGRTEEGYSYTNYRFLYDGEKVTLEINTQASDCDGRLDSFRELVCPVDKLYSHRSTYDNQTMTPDWQRVEEHQRDYSAEAMGY
jgi:hypothetical protein